MESSDAVGGKGLPPGWVTVEGILFSPIAVRAPIAQQLADIRDMPMRDDDVLICAPRKTGTHWVWEVASMLMRGVALPDPFTKGSLMLDFLPVQKLAEATSPRLLNTHLPYSLMPRQAREKRTKIVYITRSAKDVAVSEFHHARSRKEEFGCYEGSFSQYLRDEWFTETEAGNGFFFLVRAWNRALKDHPDHPVLLLRYEDMKEDLEREVRRLAEFLGVGAGEELIRQVAQACDFSAMKQAESTKHNPLQHRFKPGRSALRKGQVGDWKNWFTVADSELFDDVYSRRVGELQNASASPPATACSPLV